MSPTNIAVLISGNGTNLQALIDACKNSTINGTITQVISNRKDAYGLVRAKDARIPTCLHSLYKYKKGRPKDEEQEARELYDRDLADIVLSSKPRCQLVVLAGFMHIVTPKFLDALSDADIPVINLHPALPGAFNGSHAIQRAYEAYKQGQITETGLMIHYVISEVDMGEPILVEKITFREDESLEDLEKRLHAKEWQTIVKGTNIAIARLKQDLSSRE